MRKRSRIAVIGSGISGLSAAWLLNRCADVTLFESLARCGGHSHTFVMDEGDRVVPIDTGFMVFNRPDYPLCSREIAHYRRQAGASDIEWADLTDPGYAASATGISRAAGLARLHVRDRGGAWLTGATAFAFVWSQLPAYRWLGSLARAPGVTPLLEWGYQHFLRWRQRDSCKPGRCTG